MTLRINNTIAVNTDRSFLLGNATPASPVTGMLRYSFTNIRFEVYNGTAWVAILTVAQPPPPLLTWGQNLIGELGDGTYSNRSSPVSVIGGFTDWTQVSVNGLGSQGPNRTVALRANGTAWGWGDNLFGTLGDGTPFQRSSPVSVVGGFTDWIQISSGLTHTVALRANGSVWGWGRNSVGQLGDNTTISKNSPVSAVGGFTDWVQVSAGHYHTVALRANGTAWAWGRGIYGRLGNNAVTNNNRSSPVSVAGGFTDWVQISAGSEHTAAIRANGTAWAWGTNTQGQLGDNTTVNKSSPVSVVGGFTDWIQVSAGGGSAGTHTVALRANGTAWAWGNNNGCLGDNTTSLRSSPVAVVGGFTDWVQIAAGNTHSAGIRANGTAWAWGVGSAGQLGDNTTSNRSSPVSVVGGFTNWVQIAAGNTHSAAVRAV